MGKLLKFTTISALSVAAAACSGANKPVNITDLPIIEVAATHAFDTEIQANRLTFVPNDVAPWLGRLVISDTEMNLYSTDIEGREPNKTSSQNYDDIIGLNRQKSSGVFLALSSENKKLDAFVESNDEGHFKGVGYSGSELKAESFCISDQPLIDQVRLLSADNKIINLSLSLQGNDAAQLSTLEQQVTEEMATPGNAAICGYSGSSTYTLSPDTSTLRIHDGKDWTTVAVPAGTTAFTPITLREMPYLLLINGEDILLFNVEAANFESRITVISGLSIAGFNQADFVVASKSNFGGGAFGNGLVAFGQTNENRIVFVSLSYIENALLGGPAL